MYEDMKYRFLVLPRYEKDLEAIFQNVSKFNLKTVLLISKQILQVLEYIHEKGYIHSDIKAANIMLSKVTTLGKNTKSTDLSTYSKSPVAVFKQNCLKLRSAKVRKLTEPVYYTRKVKCNNYNVDKIFDNCSIFESDNEEEEFKKIKYRKLRKVEETIRDQVRILNIESVA